MCYPWTDIACLRNAEHSGIQEKVLMNHMVVMRFKNYAC